MTAISMSVGDETAPVQKVADLFGGTRVLAHPVSNAIEAHDMLLHGLPAPALDYLVNNLVVLGKSESLEKAVGMSLRTYQRRMEKPGTPLNQEQSGRAWKFAEILAKATAVLGSQKQAELWLDEPATGLGGRRPIDLLSTPAGVELVGDFLVRLEYGVYA